MIAGDRVWLTLRGTFTRPERATVVSVGESTAIVQIDGASTDTLLVRSLGHGWRLGSVDGRRCTVTRIVGGKGQHASD